MDTYRRSKDSYYWHALKSANQFMVYLYDWPGIWFNMHISFKDNKYIYLLNLPQQMNQEDDDKEFHTCKLR